MRIYQKIVFRSLFVFCVFTIHASAQTNEKSSVTTLKKLSIEELMNIEVTSVSKRPEKLTAVASAIQVITREDIHRSGATSVPEALRLCPNLQVAQVNSHHWIISARGFNSTYSNKLLVMIDGRTVYSPLFAGVFWDVQNVLLEDVDRIEVISGPGGALWGANAVNGVINIITRKAKDVKGGYASAAVGTSLLDLFEARYAGAVGSKFFYRIYGQHRDRDSTLTADGKNNNDKWRLTQGGFSFDWLPSASNTITVQGNLYGAVEKTNPTSSSADGQNILARWTHNFSSGSELAVQTYFDRTWRQVPSTISDQLNTYDVDIQHRFTPGKSHITMWGLGYRFMDDKTINTTIYAGLIPASRKMDLFSSFIQDELTILDEKLKLTLGSKFQHNNFSGFEIQPSARMAFTIDHIYTLWGAISRAVRTPSRLDVDYHIPTYKVPPNLPSVDGGPNFSSEEVYAYELGYRLQNSKKWNASLAIFNNFYDHLYTVDSLPNTYTYQIQNGAKGHSYGLEFSGNFQATSWWRLRGGYTYFHKTIERREGYHTLLISLTNSGIDAKNIILLQSVIDMPFNFQFDVVFRYVDELPLSQFSKPVPGYSAFDVRLAWVRKHWEFSANAQNLLHNREPEFGNIKIPQNLYVKGVFRF
jgi:iron complex outermembrane receptor protein